MLYKPNIWTALVYFMKHRTFRSWCPGDMRVSYSMEGRTGRRLHNWEDGRRPDALALVHTLVIRSDRNTNWQIDSGFVWCSAWHGRKGGERVLTLTIPPGELALLGDLVLPLGRSRATGVGGARWCPALGKLRWPYQCLAVFRR